MKQSMTPSGVEHRYNEGMTRRTPRMKQSMTPSGVEHKDPAYRDFKGELDEAINDALGR